MHIVHIVAEFAPLAKMGGLADVILGLSRELQKKGHTVEVILPKYDTIADTFLREAILENSNLASYEQMNWYQNKIWKITVEECTLYLIEPDHPKNYFKEGVVYTGNFDISRYLYFSRASLEFLLSRKSRIDIVHVHDWHTAICPFLYQQLYWQTDLKVRSFVLNIHNLHYQGECIIEDLEKIGLSRNILINNPNITPDYFSHPESVNLLKTGITTAQAVVAVSPNYAYEILTVEQSFGLEMTLRKEQSKLTGIINGIDYHTWNPQTDASLPNKYSSNQSVDQIISAKAANKKNLQEKLSLPIEDRPLISVISRLVPQKGPHLMKEGLLYAVEKGAQAILLGSILDHSLHEEFDSFKKECSSNPHIVFYDSYDEGLARLIYAASDFLLIPSLFEPCGLTQLISMRYGTIPIVRQTGGLADTVIDIQSNLPEELKNGFVFDSLHRLSVKNTMDRALTFFNKKEQKDRLVDKIMKIDFSWGASCQKYIDLYQNLIEKQSIS